MWCIYAPVALIELIIKAIYLPRYADTRHYICACVQSASQIAVTLLYHYYYLILLPIGLLESRRNHFCCVGVYSVKEVCILWGWCVFFQCCVYSVTRALAVEVSWNSICIRCLTQLLLWGQTHNEMVPQTGLNNQKAMWTCFIMVLLQDQTPMHQMLFTHPNMSILISLPWDQPLQHP